MKNLLILLSFGCGLSAHSLYSQSILNQMIETTSKLDVLRGRYVVMLTEAEGMRDEANRERLIYKFGPEVEI